MLIGIDANEANVDNRVGSNIYAFELIKAIEKLDNDNEYIVYLREKKHTHLPQLRGKFSYRVIPPKKLWTQWRLPLDLYLQQPRPDVFFTPGHYAPRFSPIPTAISILDLSFLFYPETFRPLVLRQLTTWTKRSALKASHIFTISQSSKKDIISHYQVAPEKITVTYPGIRHEFRQKVSPDLVAKVKAKYGLNHPYFLHLGTRQPRKNLDRLIEAFHRVSQSTSTPVSLVLTGKTWWQFAGDPSVKKTLPHDIIETGFVPDADLPALVKGAAALIVPSLYEGFGLPVAEAMAIGTLVITSNTSSLPEVVGECGILVDPESIDSITKGIGLALSLSKGKKVQLITAAKARAKAFTWENCARKTLEVLHGFAV